MIDTSTPGGHGSRPLIGVLLQIELVLTRPVEHSTCAVGLQWLGVVQPLMVIDSQGSPLRVEEIGAR